MRKIDTIEELKKERKRLALKRIAVENDIQNDIVEIKSMLAPVNMAKKGLGHIVHKPDNKDLFSATGGVFTEWIVRYVILRNSGFVKKWVVSKASSNIISNVLHNNKDNIYSKLAHLLLKFYKKDHNAPVR